MSKKARVTNVTALNSIQEDFLDIQERLNYTKNIVRQKVTQEELDEWANVAKHLIDDTKELFKTTYAFFRKEMK